MGIEAGIIWVYYQFSTNPQAWQCRPLSRLPIKDSEGKDEDLPTELVLLMEAIDLMPITAGNIRKWTQSDAFFTRVYYYTQKGWPMDILETLKLYSSRWTELSTLNECLLWKNRVVIPEPERRQLLNELHQAHIGIGKMKSLVHMYLWWPKSMMILRKWWDSVRSVDWKPYQHHYSRGNGQVVLGTEFT